MGPTATPAPTATPTITPTPLPEQVILSGVKYEDQHGRWNYCGPANLSMALTFWGWDGNRDVVGKAVKPSDKDKNVMPYEMETFVESELSGMAALVRVGGDIPLIKRMLAAGFPVLVEKGYYEYDYTGKLGWLGHYQFVNGYDEAQDILVLQDTYVKDGKDHRTSYKEFIEGWRSFNYTFLIVYPADREGEVLTLLGPYADPNWANSHALEVAKAESEMLTGIDQFFAWFNRGSSLAALQQYADAGPAFDQAFSLYAALPDDGTRPYRILWYQTWPYWAYFYSGRYQDVINLADTTLIDTISEPVLEESFYWRALAREATGDVQGAIDDLRESVRLNPVFSPGWEQLNRLDPPGG
jgi:tetratricopeptide (TPR) repeat protein